MYCINNYEEEIQEAGIALHNPNVPATLKTYLDEARSYKLC